MSNLCTVIFLERGHVLLRQIQVVKYSYASDQSGLTLDLGFKPFGSQQVCGPSSTLARARIMQSAGSYGGR